MVFFRFYNGFYNGFYVGGGGSYYRNLRVGFFQHDSLSYIYHTVRSGESLGKIAAKYHLSLAQLKKLNPGKGNIIQVGDKIRIK